jgi:hypothetical protein
MQPVTRWLGVNQPGERLHVLQDHEAYLQGAYRARITKSKMTVLWMPTDYVSHTLVIIHTEDEEHLHLRLLHLRCHVDTAT